MLYLFITKMGCTHSSDYTYIKRGRYFHAVLTSTDDVLSLTFAACAKATNIGFEYYVAETNSSNCRMFMLEIDDVLRNLDRNVRLLQTDKYDLDGVRICLNFNTNDSWQELLAFLKKYVEKK